jgi:ABC-type phosphate transport system substrate-binding protein
MMYKHLRLIGLLFAASFSGSAMADIAIVANPELNIEAIQPGDVRNLYLGERQAFPNGIPAVPINHVKGSPDREEFFASVLSMGESTHKRHWKRKQAVGNHYAPKEVSSYEELLESVSNTPGAIGYIDASKVDDSVKVLLTVPSFNDV